MYRIGHGYDTHCFVVGKPLILGGVTIAYDKGMQAHSDGDVIIHALCDALLGAATLGDIGQHFPDTQLQYANINSRLLLQQVMILIAAKNYKVGNVDITVLAQVPKLADYLISMRTLLAADLAITLEDINIKATTTEKMGFVGRAEGIACYAVALLVAIDAPT